MGLTRVGGDRTLEPSVAVAAEALAVALSELTVLAAG